MRRMLLIRLVVEKGSVSLFRFDLFERFVRASGPWETSTCEYNDLLWTPTIMSKSPRSRVISREARLIL